MVAPTPRPGPTPYGRLVANEVGKVDLWYQTLFPLQTSNVPESYLTGLAEDLPRGVQYVSRNSRFVLWIVMFDVSQAPPGWKMNGYVRWYNVNSGYDPLLMLESEVYLDHETFMFYKGMGKDSPGFWRPGEYRTVLLNEDLEEVLSWEFDVR